MSNKKKENVQRCLLCKAPVHHEFRPFCSIRCKQVDLNRWFSEVYTIPVEEEQNPDDIKEDHSSSSYNKY